MVFMRLIRILTGILVFWLLFDSLHRLFSRGLNVNRIERDDNGRIPRKYVESHIVKE